MLYHSASYIGKLLIGVLNEPVTDTVRQSFVFLASIANTPFSACPALASKHPRQILDSLIPPFTTHERVRTAIQFILCGQAHAVQALLISGFRKSSVDRALRSVNLMRALLMDDPMLESGHLILLAPVYTTGKILVDTYASASEPQTSQSRKDTITTDPTIIKEAVNVCWGCLDALGKNFGLQACKLAAAFHDMMLSAGLTDKELVPDPGEIEVELEDDDQVEGKALFFADKILANRADELSLTGSNLSQSRNLAKSGSRTM